MMGFEPRRGSMLRSGSDASDRGSMPIALLVTLVGMAMSAALVPVVVSQITSTRTVAARTDALRAAQAGIDVALGQLRSATDNIGDGNLETLPPCDLTGSAGMDGSRFRVVITYFRLAANGTSEAEPQGCPPSDVPVTARLISTGGGPTAGGHLSEGGAGTRTIQATYTFKTNNENITGGAIRLASPTTDPLCMDAGPDASPVAGTNVRMQQCKAGGSSDQRFAYTADLTIKLVGSETSTAPQGMCLEAPVPHANGGFVTFQPCLERTARQQWSLDDSSHFRGTPDGVGLDQFCFNLATPATAGSNIVLGGCTGTADRNVFRPQAGVGAGMASASTGQLVNYKQFSRCLDVTNHNPNYSYMIVWFCKQAPDGNVSWNQKWSLPAAVSSVAEAQPERIRTAGSGNPGYCLRSPGATAADQYVTMLSCPETGTLTDESLKWTIFGDTGNYATSYRIVDAYGYCLTPTDLTVTPRDTHTDGTAKAKVAVCNNSELQKWNAPANFNQPLVLSNTREK